MTADVYDAGMDNNRRRVTVETVVRDYETGERLSFSVQEEVLAETSVQTSGWPRPLPTGWTEAGYPDCGTCDGGACHDCVEWVG